MTCEINSIQMYIILPIKMSCQKRSITTIKPTFNELKENMYSLSFLTERLAPQSPQSVIKHQKETTPSHFNALP